ncbi:hypothetical protein BGZ65_007184, partial [Modicella reniformis]
AGRYNSIDTSFEKGTVSFTIMMVIFYFFSVILLLYVLIAIMNDAFNESEKEGELAHWKLLSGVIAEVETHAMFNAERERGDYYPKQIYYCASEEEAVQFHSKYSITDVSNLSAENRFLVEASASSIQETKRTINDNIMALGKDMVELRTLVERPHSYDKVEQELSELKELFKDLVFQLKTKNVLS